MKRTIHSVGPRRQARNSTASETAPTAVWRRRGNGRTRRATDRVAVEEPLEIRVRGRSVAVIMRSPGHDAELAAGFLLSEGLVRTRGEVLKIALSRRGAAPENTLNVFLAPSVEVDFEQLTRHVFAASSCGLCGKASIEAVHRHFLPVAPGVTVSQERLRGLPDQLRSAQKAFAQTGGLHAAAVFDLRGKLVVLREDVGRHNAVDKVLGWGFLQGRLPFDRHILMVSGRASFEILQKALAARIPVVAAISAPSSLAVEFARESSQTLIGFLRGETMNIYSRPENVTSRRTAPR